MLVCLPLRELVLHCPSVHSSHRPVPHPACDRVTKWVPHHNHTAGFLLSLGMELQAFPEPASRVGSEEPTSRRNQLARENSQTVTPLSAAQTKPSLEAGACLPSPLQSVCLQGLSFCVGSRLLSGGDRWLAWAPCVHNLSAISVAGGTDRLDAGIRGSPGPTWSSEACLPAFAPRFLLACLPSLNT